VQVQSKLVELEALRGFAALYVLLHHALPLEAIHPFVALPFRFGQEAVILFFLVSGYVIHRSWPGALRKYAIARVLRIYPIFFFALALSYACASVSAGALLPPDLASLAGNLLMLQDRAREGGIVTPYMGNAPLWSLSYEVFFYVAYAAAMRTGRPHAVALVASSVGLAAMLLLPFQGFRFLAYFMVWWIGVGFAEAERGNRNPLLAALVCATGATVAFALHLRPVSSTVDFPVLELRHFGAALLFSAAALTWQRIGRSAPGWFFAPFVAIAPISYGLYAVHYPLLTSGLTPAAAVAAAFLLAVVIERISGRLTGRLRGSSSQSAPKPSRYTSPRSATPRRGLSAVPSRRSD